MKIIILLLKRTKDMRSSFQRIIELFPKNSDFKTKKTILIDNLINYLGSWSVKEKTNSSEGLKGSVSSEDESYVALVKLAVTDEKVFKKFKSNREYREILEHVNREQGAVYLETVQRYETATQKLIDFCKLNTNKPYRYRYPSVGKVSPTNLRYAKVALDLNSLFGDMSRFAIAEIGIGYGGQLQAILAQSGFADYTVFDLDPVVELAKKYLCYQNLGEFKLISKSSHSNSKKYDLVISNYAFSELDRKSQEMYLENVITKSKRGYLIYNKITPEVYNSISVSEFCKRVEGCIVVNEFPNTAPENQLVIWGFESTDELILD